CTVAVSTDIAVGKTYVLGGECVRLRSIAERCVELTSSGARIVPVPWALVSAAATFGRFAGPVYPDQPARLRAPKPGPAPAARSDLSLESRPLADGLRAVLPAT